MAGHAPRALRVVRSIEIEAEPSAPLCVLCFDPITDDTIPLTNCACSVCSVGSFEFSFARFVCLALRSAPQSQQ
eukprot:m.447893 g.447893  ORF g.447893 m.447893 type:complete len:74 (+) comp56883_c1_seq5:301-522(+)